MTPSVIARTVSCHDTFFLKFTKKNTKKVHENTLVEEPKKCGSLETTRRWEGHEVLVNEETVIDPT
jgi:hypothetical protein